MNVDYQQAFDFIAGRVEEELVKSGYTRQKVSSEDSNELVALFTSETVAYSVVYIKDKQQMVLRSSAMTEEGPDNDWKTLATWLYDDETSDKKDAESIANDFLEGVAGTVAIRRAKQVKQKKKKSDDGTADPKFLAKRFVSFFPELKEEIQNEEDCYYPFRGATFAKEHIAPKAAKFLKNAKGKELQKFAALFNTQYANGDADTRSIITIVILNSLDDTAFSTLYEELDEDTQKAAKAGRKLLTKREIYDKIALPLKGAFFLCPAEGG